MPIRKYINPSIHLLIWIIIVYIFDQVFRTEFRTYHIIDGRKTENIAVHTFLPVLFIAVLFKAIFFYINAFPGLLSLIKAQKRTKYILFISLIFIALFGIELLAIAVLSSLLHFEGPPFQLFIWPDLLLYIITLGISLTYFLMREWDKAEKLSGKIAEEQLKTELNFLKAQINPHFFLNTLNNLYSMAQARDLDELEDGILRLSEMMQYVLYECRADAVPIEREIEYIKSYISLTLIRYRQDGNIKVIFNVHDNVPTNFMIAPVILIPFIENAFKHGISHDSPSVVEINLDIKKSQLFFNVKNSCNFNQQQKFNNSGIGKANVTRRLEMLYPGRHQLKISNENGLYDVSLILTA